MDSTIQTQNKRGLHSQAIDLLRFPLAAFVVAEHVFPNVRHVHFQSDTLPFDISNSPLILQFVDFITMFVRGYAVPIFFFISGYLFFLGAEFSKDIYLNKIKSRIKTLLIPYILWNVLAIASLFISRLPIFAAYINHPEMNISLRAFLSAFWIYSGEFTGVEHVSAYPINVPLWYIRDLMVVVLCSPLIYTAIKKFKLYPLVILGVIWFFTLQPSSYSNGLATAFFFFTCGAYISIHKIDFLAKFNRYFAHSLILLICIGIIGLFSFHYFPEATKYIRRVNILIGVILAFNIASRLLKKRGCQVNSFLASSSFVIYAGHFILIPYLSKIISIFCKHTSVSQLGLIALYTVQWATLIIILLGAFWAMKRYTPSLLRVLTGRK